MRALVAATGGRPDAVTDEFVRGMCRSAAYLELLHTRPLSSELGDASNGDALMEAVAEAKEEQEAAEAAAAEASGGGGGDSDGGAEEEATAGLHKLTQLPLLFYLGVRGADAAAATVRGRSAACWVGSLSSSQATWHAPLRLDCGVGLLSPPARS